MPCFYGDVDHDQDACHAFYVDVDEDAYLAHAISMVTSMSMYIMPMSMHGRVAGRRPRERKERSLTIFRTGLAASRSATPLRGNYPDEREYPNEREASYEAYDAQEASYERTETDGAAVRGHWQVPRPGKGKG
jgi:hypothetical protein